MKRLGFCFVAVMLVGVACAAYGHVAELITMTGGDFFTESTNGFESVQAALDASMKWTSNNAGYVRLLSDRNETIRLSRSGDFHIALDGHVLGPDPSAENGAVIVVTGADSLVTLTVDDGRLAGNVVVNGGAGTNGFCHVMFDDVTLGDAGPGDLGRISATGWCSFEFAPGFTGNCISPYAIEEGIVTNVYVEAGARFACDQSAIIGNSDEIELALDPGTGYYTAASPQYPMAAFDDWNNPSCWMSGMLQNIPVSSLMMISSHDAGMVAGHCFGVGYSFCITQKLTAGEQMRAGARFFDLRPRKTTSWFTCHGSCLGQKFSTIFKDARGFLHDNPSEVLFMRISHYDDKKLAKLIDMICKDYKDILYKNSSKPVLNELTLRDVRGKVVLLIDRGMLEGARYGVALDPENYIWGLDDAEGKECRPGNDGGYLYVHDDYANKDDFDKMKSYVFGMWGVQSRHYGNGSLSAKTRAFMLCWQLTMQKPSTGALSDIFTGKAHVTNAMRAHICGKNLRASLSEGIDRNGYIHPMLVNLDYLDANDFYTINAYNERYRWSGSRIGIPVDVWNDLKNHSLVTFRISGVSNINGYQDNGNYWIELPPSCVGSTVEVAFDVVPGAVDAKTGAAVASRSFSFVIEKNKDYKCEPLSKFPNMVGEYVDHDTDGVLIKRKVSENELTRFTAQTTVLSKGKKYVADRNTSISGSLRVEGDGWLLLPDGCRLEVGGGIRVPQYLSIYAQGNGTGELVARGVDGQAGIGGGGRVTIHGGVITATGGSGSAGIGGDRYGSPEVSFVMYDGTLTATGGSGGAGIGSGKQLNDNESGHPVARIYGGTIRTLGGSEGAGIGGGRGGSGGEVAIYNGTVTTTGGVGGAGVGGGEKGACGEVVIYGGSVTATGGGGGPGIGMGQLRYHAGSGTVTVYGGTVTATGGHSGAGIGGGYDSVGVIVRIVDGVVTAVGGDDGAGIGGGVSGTLDIDGGTLEVLGGTVTAKGGDRGAGIGGGLNGPGAVVKISGGSVTAGGGQYGAAIGGGSNGSGGWLSVSGGRIEILADKPHSQAIGRGYAGARNGSTEISGGLFSDSSRVDILTIVDGFVMTANPDSNTSERYPWMVAAPYVIRTDADTKETQYCPKVTFLRETTALLTTSTWYFVSCDTVVTGRLAVCGDAALILKDGVKLTAPEGIVVPEGSSLKIFGQELGTGELSARGHAGCAGIGGGDGQSCGAVTVHGGTITSVGGSEGAGIGGGRGGSGGEVAIYGGSVTATGGDGGAGIGGGQGGDGGAQVICCDSVTATGGSGGAGVGGGAYGAGGAVAILRGTVSAVGGEYAAGIGGGTLGTGGAVAISGGTVTAAGGDFGAGIGSSFEGTGGTVTISGGTVTAVGGMNSAGIGSGVNGSGGKVTIFGGVVTSVGGANAAGIGGGYKSKGGSVSVYDGTVTARGGAQSSDIGGGYKAVSDTSLMIAGGAVNAVMTDGDAVNMRSERVYRVDVACDGLTGRLVLEGVANYGCQEIFSVDGHVGLWLQEGSYYFSLGDGARTLHYYAVVNGMDVSVEPLSMTGLLVNGSDCGVGKGPGWICRDGVLDLEENVPYVLSGMTTNGDIQVEISDSVTSVVLSNAVVITKARPAMVVKDRASVTLATAGGVSCLAATNDASAVTLAAGARLSIVGSSADSSLCVFSSGEPAAVYGAGTLSVSDTTLLVWADGPAVETLFDTDADAVIKVGDGPESAVYTNDCGTASYVLVAPGVTLTLRDDIPHAEEFVVSNSVEVLEGVSVSGGKEYRLMPGEDVFIGYTVEEGCFSRTANPLVVRDLADDVVVDGSAIVVDRILSYRFWNTTSRQIETRSCSDYSFVTAGTDRFDPGRWYAVSGEVEVPSRIKVNGDVHLILCDGAKLTASAGIQVNDGNTLSIYGQDEGSGRLVARSTSNAAAAIGSYAAHGDYGFGNVKIHGGVIEAITQKYGACIGSGMYSGRGGRSDGGTVAVFGGRVTARLPQDADSSVHGIGGGAGGGVKSVMISGGTVTVLGGAVSSGIDPGSCRSVSGSSSAGTLTISGGNVQAGIRDRLPRNPRNEIVYCVTVKCGSDFADASGGLRILGLSDYGFNDVYPVDGKVCLWLPDGNYGFVLTDGVVTRSYYAAVKGRGCTVEPRPPVGFFVNGIDVGCGQGEGWSCDGEVLKLAESGPFVLSGSTTDGLVAVEVSRPETSVVLSNAVVLTSGRAALSVKENASVTLEMTGGTSCFAATNDAPAIAVHGGARLVVDVLSSGDRLESALCVFSSGAASAVSGAGEMSVSNGTLFAWSDEPAIGLPSFGLGPDVVMKAGEDHEAMVFAAKPGSAPCVLAAPGVSVMVRAIPHVEGIVVSNAFVAIAGTSVSGGVAYRVMAGDDVSVGFAAADGFFTRTASPLVFCEVLDDLVIDESMIPVYPVLTYRQWNGESQRFEDRRCGDYLVVTKETDRFESGRWYVVADEVVVSNSIWVAGESHLILCDGARLTVWGGIQVSPDSALSIYGQTENTGLLQSYGEDWAAGIGGSYHMANGAVTVHGGTIHAIGGRNGAGIGGGSSGGGGTVIVYGGVFSVGGGLVDRTTEYVPAFGPGVNGKAGVVRISGGVFSDFMLTDDSWFDTGCFKIENPDPDTRGAYPWAVARTMPIIPGRPVVVSTASSASNVASIASLLPSEAVAGVLTTESARRAYAEKFAFEISPVTGGWAVEAVLTPDSQSNLLASAAAAARQLPVADIATLPMDKTAGALLCDCWPGFYYSLWDDCSVTNLTADSYMSNLNVLCGAEGNVVFPEVKKPSEASGFFSVGARALPDVRAGDSRETLSERARD